MDITNKPELFGVPRSGGTLIYHIVDYLYGNMETQNHDYFETQNKVIATYRDFRDGVVSWWRMEVGGFDNMENARNIQLNEFLYYANRMKGRAEKLNKMRDYYPEKQILFLRYEDFVNNFPFIYDNLEKFLGMSILEDQKKEIYEKFNINANKKEASKHRDFMSWDPKRHIHGNHILNGKVGNWKIMLDEQHHSQVTEDLRTFLEEWEYLND